MSNRQSAAPLPPRLHVPPSQAVPPMTVSSVEDGGAPDRAVPSRRGGFRISAWGGTLPFVLTAVALGWCLASLAMAQEAPPADRRPRSDFQELEQRFLRDLPGRNSAAEPQISSRELERRFRRGRELLAEENFSEGTRLLQSVLETDEDEFFYLESDGESSERSLKFEAQSLLGGMPAAGRELYEKQYGPIARRLLTDAQASGDAELLAFITRRYFHTRPGLEAAYRLAGDALDHGHPLTAALALERLRHTPLAKELLEPLLSVKTALAWWRAGRTDKALETLTQLRAERPTSRILLGGRHLPAFESSDQARAWLLTVLEPRQDSAGAADHWTMVRGNPRRNATSSGGSPYLNQSWRVSLLEGSGLSPEQDAALARALGERRRDPASGGDDEGGTPMVPGFQPLIVGSLAIARGLSDVRAYHLATGELAWATGEKDQLLLELLRVGGGPQAQLPGMSPLTYLMTQRIWGDSAFATLSSDGELVYVVEDLGLNGTPPMQIPRVTLNRDFNRLVAYDVRTGKAVWEAGGAPGNGTEDLAGHFFLGAPLVLDRRLYGLAEVSGEIRLVVMDPSDGRRLWTQTLNNDPDLAWDASRRRSGLTPSFDGGILVCPTGSDQTTAVDLTGRLLLWRYRLRDRSETYDARPNQVILQQQQMLARLQTNGGIDQNRWLDSTAIISDGRVLLTPRDANDLHCIHLLDGTLAWKEPRGDGLFVGGVHNGHVVVIGRTFVQALRLDDGQPAWEDPVAIPVPSGRGFIAGDLYHLPLSTAEVASIDLRRGQIVSRSRSMQERVPGNLVSVGGHVMSQGADFLEGFPQLETLENEVAGRLINDPDDGAALALRGEILLQRGQVQQAYVALQRALDLQSDDEVIRQLLVGSLLEGLRVDFAEYRHLPVDFDRLFAAPEQRSAYLWLQAAGYSRMGDPHSAFESLLKFADLSVSDREQERVGATQTVRRDRLVQSRAAQLAASATPGERNSLERTWRARMESLREEGNAAGLRRFAHYFGGLFHSPELIESQFRAASTGNWLEEELQWRPWCDAKDPALAAQATGRLAALLLAAERPRDALSPMARLERDWPQVVALDGLRGVELVSQWKERPEVRRALAPAHVWPSGVVRAEREPNVGNPTSSRAFMIPLEGDRHPYFADVTLEISGRWQDFIARDTLGRPIWKVSLDSPIPTTNFVFNRAYPCEHLLIIAIGTQVVAIDTLGTAEQPGARLLWRMNLIDIPSGAIVPRGMGNFRRRMPLNQMVADQLGSVGPVARDYVAVFKGRKLMALEPLTGKPLWTRDGMTPGSEALGDEELLFVIPPDSTRAQMYRALDGELLGDRDFPAAGLRVGMTGRFATTWQETPEGQVLTSYDIAAQQVRWQRPFAPGAQIAVIDERDVAVLEPGGRFTVVALADGAPRWEAAVGPQPRVHQLVVVRSGGMYLAIINEPLANSVPQWIQSNLQSLPVNGTLHGFDVQTGQPLWTTRIQRQLLDMNQPAGLPLLTFMVQTQEPRAKAGALVENKLNLLCLDKRTGRVLYEDKRRDEPSLFYVEYGVDFDQQQIELKLARSTVRLTFTDTPWPEEGK
ncbi:MAG: PQQ-binding-like beta-propeller repeat protein [Planctomycetales bacterium]